MRRRVIVMFHFSEGFSEDEVFNLLGGGDAFECFCDMFDKGSIYDSLSFRHITNPRPVSEKHCKKFLDETPSSLKHQKDNPIKINNVCRYLFEFREPNKDRIGVLRNRLASAQRIMDGPLPSDVSMAYSKVLSALGLGTRTGVIVLLAEFGRGDDEDTLTYYSTATSLKGMLVDPEVSLKGHFFLFGAFRADDIRVVDAADEDAEDDFDLEYVDAKEKPKRKDNVVFLPDARKRKRHG